MPAFRLYRVYFVSHGDVPLESIDGRLLPDPTFESVLSIRVRVAGFLVDRIQRIQSQRAKAVMSIHALRACGTDASAFLSSPGSGSDRRQLRLLTS